MENPIKMDDLRGTIIFGNTHMLIYSKFTSFFKGDPLIPQMEVTLKNPFFFDLMLPALCFGHGLTRWVQNCIFRP